MRFDSNFISHEDIYCWYKLYSLGSHSTQPLMRSTAIPTICHNKSVNSPGQRRNQINLHDRTMKSDQEDMQHKLSGESSNQISRRANSLKSNCSRRLSCGSDIHMRKNPQVDKDIKQKTAHQPRRSSMVPLIIISPSPQENNEIETSEAVSDSVARDTFFTSTCGPRTSLPCILESIPEVTRVQKLSNLTSHLTLSESHGLDKYRSQIQLKAKDLAVPCSGAFETVLMKMENDQLGN